MLMALTGSWLIGTALLTAAPPTIDGTHRLFLDDALIESTRNIQRRVESARKFDGNPVIWGTEPWEDKSAVLYGSVIRDGDRYKCWYKTGDGVAYAESKDGIAWDRPRFDLVLRDGEKSNILFRKRDKQRGPEAFPFFYELFGVHRDDAEKDPARRYKMGFLEINWKHEGPGGDPYHPGQRRGLGVAGSPDGVHWTPIRSFATEAICDGATHWMIDPASGRYVIYGRTRKTLPEVEAAWSKVEGYKDWHSGRAVARVESPDFLHWNHTAPASAPVVMTADLGDPAGTEIYSMKVFPYEGLYIGLVQVFHALPDDLTLDVQLAVSHDSVHFTRVGDRGVFLPLGRPGDWDRFNMSLANNDPIRDGDTLRFYYGGRLNRHTPYKGKDTGPTRGGIGFATVQRDRFVAMQASFDGGELMSRPLLLRGRSLHLNACSRFGEITVAIVNEAGKVIAESGEIVADGLDVPIEWKRGSMPQDDEPVRVRFRLKNARLYSFWTS